MPKTTPVYGIRYPEKTDKPLVEALANMALDAEAALDLIVPPGTMHPYAGNAAPTGFLLCDGSAVSRATYKRLFDVIETKYGPGNGTTTFNLPDTRGRTLVSPDGAAGRLSEKDALGESSGAEKVSLTIANLAAHKHADGTLAAAAHTHTDGTLKTAENFVTPHAGSFVVDFINQTSPASGNHAVANWDAEKSDVSGATGSAGADVTGESSSAGSGEGHSNMPPYLVVNTIIRI